MELYRYWCEAEVDFKVQLNHDEMNDDHAIKLTQKQRLVVVLKQIGNFEMVCIPVRILVDKPVPNYGCIYKLKQ